MTSFLSTQLNYFKTAGQVLKLSTPVYLISLFFLLPYLLLPQFQFPFFASLAFAILNIGWGVTQYVYLQKGYLQEKRDYLDVLKYIFTFLKKLWFYYLLLVVVVAGSVFIYYASFITWYTSNYNMVLSQNPALRERQLAQITQQLSGWPIHREYITTVIPNIDQIVSIGQKTMFLVTALTSIVMQLVFMIMALETKSVWQAFKSTLSFLKAHTKFLLFSFLLMSVYLGINTTLTTYLRQSYFADNILLFSSSLISKVLLAIQVYISLFISCYLLVYLNKHYLPALSEKAQEITAVSKQTKQPKSKVTSKTAKSTAKKK